MTPNCFPLELERSPLKATPKKEKEERKTFKAFPTKQSDEEEDEEEKKDESLEEPRGKKGNLGGNLIKEKFCLKKTILILNNWKSALLKLRSK